MLPDYYAILGVSRTASQLEIKAAYRAMAKKHHPDKHGGDPEKDRLFKEINQAYQVLSNTSTKMAYDKQWSWQQNHPQPPPPPATRGYTYRPQRPYSYQPPPAQEYTYSKWTLMYGKIFIALLIIVAVLFPSLLNYYFSNYFYHEGMAALEEHDYDRAEYLFQDAIRELGGSSALASIRLAEMKLAHHYYLEALAYINIGLQHVVKTPEEARLYYLRGRIYEHMNKPHEAEKWLLKAGRWHYPADSVYQALAPLYAYKLHDYKKALACYDSLIARQPEQPDYYLHRGFCRQKLEEHRAALADFNFFIEHKGRNSSVIFLKAISQLGLSKLDSACANFEQAALMGLEQAYTYIKLYCQTDTSDIVFPAHPY